MAGNDILHALWYSALALQPLGANPVILRNRNGSKFYQVSYLSVIYMVFLIFVLAASLWCCGDDWNSLNSEDGDVLVVAHSQIRLLLGPVCCILMLLSSIITAPTASQAMAGLSHFTTNLPHHFTHVHCRFLVGGSALLIVALFISYFFAIIGELISIDVISKRSLTSFGYGAFCVCWMCFDLIGSAVVTHILIWTSIMYTQFRALETELRTDLKKLSYWRPASQMVQVLPKESAALPMNVSRYRRIYINLTCTADDINQTFAFRLLLLISLNTILLFFSSYIILLNIADAPSALPLSITVPWLVSRIFLIFFAIYPFCCITKKVAGITTIVHQWIAKVDNTVVTHELQLFANEIKNKGVRFTACNFFKLEASTLTAIVGATFSYLVTLVQFHVLFREYPNRSILGAPSFGNFSDFMNITFEHANLKY